MTKKIVWICRCERCERAEDGPAALGVDPETGIWYTHVCDLDEWNEVDLEMLETTPQEFLVGWARP